MENTHIDHSLIAESILEGLKKQDIPARWERENSLWVLRLRKDDESERMCKGDTPLRALLSHLSFAHVREQTSEPKKKSGLI